MGIVDQFENSKKKPAEAESAEELLGVPRGSFRPHEIKFIEEELKSYMEIMERNPRLRPFIHNAVYSLVQSKRVEEKILTLRNESKGKAADDIDAELRRMEKQRRDHMNDYVTSLKDIGYLPQVEAETSEDDSFVSIHRKYIAEVRERKARGDSIGKVSRDAAALAKQEGIDTKRYRIRDNLADDIRETEIEESDDGRQ